MAVRSTLGALVVVMVVLVVVVSLLAEVECRNHGGRSHRRKRNWMRPFRLGDRGGFGSSNRHHRPLRDRWAHFPFGRHERGGQGRGFFDHFPPPPSFWDFGRRGRNPWRFDFVFDKDFGFPRRQRNWWEGPNVCRNVDTENGTDSEAESILHHFKTTTQVCESGEMAYKCTTTTYGPEGVEKKMVRYECCHGFSRQPGEFGCPHKRDLVDLPSLISRLGLKDMLTAIRTTGLEEELAAANFTVFAPANSSFPLPVGPGFSLEDRPNAMAVSRSLREKMEHKLQEDVLAHVIPETRPISSFSDEDVVETLSSRESTIRMNFYSWPVRLTTANCVRVTSTDNFASNGVLHTVEKVLPTVDLSLMDFIQRDEQFSYLKTALALANLVSTLQNDGQFTLLAPSNSAFQRLDRRLLDKLMAGDPACLDKVLKNHLLPNVICSEVIQGKAKSKNMLDKHMNLTRTEDGKLFVESAQVVRTDVMTTNGVLHIIDAVLVPDDALDLVSVAEKNGLTDLVHLAEKADYTSVLLNSSDVTIFAPSNKAFEAVSPEVMKQLTADQQMLQNVLAYHVVPEGIDCRRMRDRQVLDTLNAQGKLRVDKYSSFPFGHQRVTTVQCAPIVTKNLPSCNGVLHVIDKLMLPPKGNVVDVLAADPDFSTLVRLVKMAGLADDLQTAGPFTIFAPTNKAFDELGKEKMKELEDDPQNLANILKLHISQDHLCCAGILNSDGWYHRNTQIRSAGSTYLSLARDRSGQLLVDNAVISSCDHMATNGVVQGINSVLLPRMDPWHFMFPWI